MELISIDGVVNMVEVPLLSYSADPKTGNVRKDSGIIRFRETVFSHNEWYFGIVESDVFMISFHNYYPVNGNPGMRSAFAAPSYHQVRTWINQVVDSVSRQLLSTHPQATMYKPDGTPEHEPDKEVMVAAWELFVQARPAEATIDKTPTDQISNQEYGE